MKVLLIEDNPVDALMICSLLDGSAGGRISIECADRLSAGLERLADGSIDAVLLGLSLPDSAGFETLTQVSACAPRLPVVVLTGTDDEAMASRAVRSGAQDYLIKSEMSGSLLVRSLRYARERKQAQEQLRHAQKMESIGTLAGGIAHDFNNMLTGIMGFADLGLLGVAPGSRLHGTFSDIKGLAERAANLTRQLMTFARKQVPARQRIDLNATITELAKLLARIMGREIELSLALAGDLASVRADLSQIEQVLMNLCLNSRDAMPQGGTLRIETANVTVDDPRWNADLGARPRRFVRMLLSDTGIGMDPTTLARAFDPFFTTKEPGQGTGLGLAVVYGIIQQHEGWIDVSSRPGHGTVFQIFLPVAPEPGDPVQTEALGGRNETILVVEDDDVVAHLMGAVLGPLGYVLQRATDGEEALEILQANPDGVDLVISDIALPWLGSNELVGAIRHRKPGQKFLLVSRSGPDAPGTGELPGGAVDLISKPFTRLELARKVREILDRAEPAGETR